jgi:hypothetical protein
MSSRNGCQKETGGRGQDACQYPERKIFMSLSQQKEVLCGKAVSDAINWAHQRRNEHSANDHYSRVHV